MKRAVPVCVAAIWLSLAAATLAGDWPQWRGPHRNGHADLVAPFTGPLKVEQVWEAEVGTGFSSFAVTQGCVWTIGNQDEQDTLWCLKIQDGSPVWKHTYPAPLDPNLFEGGPTSTPTVADHRVYTISRMGEIYCLEADSGNVVWHVTINEQLQASRPSWGFAGSPFLLGDRLYFNVGSAGLCLNPDTGEVIWESDTSELAGYTSPFLVQAGETSFLLIESEKALKAVNPENGEVLWKHQWLTRYGINAADPVMIGDGRLILTSGYQKGGVLLEFSAQSAKEKWRSREIRSQMSPGVVIGDSLFAIDGDAGRDPRLICVQAETGAVKWFSREVAAGSVISVGKQAAILSETGEFSLLPEQVAGYAPLVRHQILEGKCWTPMAFADELFFARNAEGHVVCVKVTAAAEESPK